MIGKSTVVLEFINDRVGVPIIKVGGLSTVTLALGPVSAFPLPAASYTEVVPIEIVRLPSVVQHDTVTVGEAVVPFATLAIQPVLFPLIVTFPEVRL